MINSSMAKLSPECLSLVQGTAHTLIAGTTGSGKSVLLNSILYSLYKLHLITFNSRRPLFVFVDTKRVELKEYKNSALTLAYVTEPEDVPDHLDTVIEMMDLRYELMEGKTSDDSPIHVVIDELADLLDTPGVLERIIKIGRLGRAANIHLLCCTQDPSRRTLSAQLMQNFTTCVALRCRDQIESKQIIRMPGAEDLPRHGKAIVCDSEGSRVINIPMIPDGDIAVAISTMDDMFEHFSKKNAGEFLTCSDELARKIEGHTLAEAAGVLV